MVSCILSLIINDTRICKLLADIPNARSNVGETCSVDISSLCSSAVITVASIERLHVTSMRRQDKNHPFLFHVPTYHIDSLEMSGNGRLRAVRGNHRIEEKAVEMSRQGVARVFACESSVFSCDISHDHWRKPCEAISMNMRHRVPSYVAPIFTGT